MDKYEELHELKLKMAELEKREETLKNEIQSELESQGITNVKNDYVTISHVDASTTETIDVKALEQKEPELYKELLQDYPKVTSRKAYYKFLVK